MANSKLFIPLVLTLGLVTPTVSATAATAAPPAPTAATVAAPTPPQVQLHIPIGRGVRVTWNPAVPAQKVTMFKVVATATGVPSTYVPSGCVLTNTVWASAGETAATVDNLCPHVAYVSEVSTTTAPSPAQMSSTNSATSKKTDPVVALDPTSPDPPGIVATFARPSAVVVRWNTPIYTGGAPVTQYRLSVPGKPVVVVNPSTAPCVQTQLCNTTIAGLTNNVPVSVTVTAVNAAGTSSTVSAPVTPKAASNPTEALYVSATSTKKSTLDVS